jgi:hypothetical protein
VVANQARLDWPKRDAKPRSVRSAAREALTRLQCTRLPSRCAAGLAPPTWSGATGRQGLPFPACLFPTPPAATLPAALVHVGCRLDLGPMLQTCPNAAHPRARLQEGDGLEAHARTRTRTRTRTHAHTHTHTRTHAHAHAHASHAHAHANTRTHTRMHARTRTHARMHTRAAACRPLAASAPITACINNHMLQQTT